MERLHKLEAMTKDIAIAHDSVGGRHGGRKLDLQFDLCPLA
jgi:hypothetical protein